MISGFKVGHYLPLICTNKSIILFSEQWQRQYTKVKWCNLSVIGESCQCDSNSTGISYVGSISVLQLSTLNWSTHYLRPTPTRNNHGHNFVSLFFFHNYQKLKVWCLFLWCISVQLNIKQTITSYLENCRTSYLDKWCSVCVIYKFKNCLFT